MFFILYRPMDWLSSSLISHCDHNFNWGIKQRSSNLEIAHIRYREQVFKIMIRHSNIPISHQFIIVVSVIEATPNFKKGIFYLLCKSFQLFDCYCCNLFYVQNFNSYKLLRRWMYLGAGVVKEGIWTMPRICWEWIWINSSVSSNTGLSNLFI